MGPDEVRAELQVAVERVEAVQVLLAVLIVVAFIIIARLVRRGIRDSAWTRDTLGDATDRVATWTSWILVVSGVVLALAELGLNLVPILVVLLIGLAVVSFAGRGVLEDIAAGFQIQSRRPFRLHDRIEVVGQTGVITEIGSRSVKIVTLQQSVVDIANRDLVVGPIVNYTTNPVRRGILNATITYDSDGSRAKSLLVEAAQNAEGVHESPSPTAYVVEFGESGIALALHYWYADEDRFSVPDRVAEGVQAAFDSRGVAFAYPRRVIEIQDAPDESTANR